MREVGCVEIPSLNSTICTISASSGVWIGDSPAISYISSSTITFDQNGGSHRGNCMPRIDCLYEENVRIKL